jgi:protocatechuate 3,4-dioxygenase beta subunit
MIKLIRANERRLPRRQILGGLGMALAAAPVAQLLGCGADDAGAASPDAGATSPDGSAATDGATGGWATGGTAAMTMAASYPNPFASGVGSTCKLTCASTLGPCYATTIMRKDISEGQNGLPVRLAFLVVNEACQPVSGATVDIWHTSPAGLYSGNDASQMCTLGNAQAIASRWFRGVQPTDGQGRADFDTCFPGWYSGRTIHIHFTVRVGSTEYVTSQLFFDDALNDDILNSQALYNDRGQRNTRNSNDNVISAASVAEYSFQTQKMADGALLAWKTLVVRASSSALCNIPGGMGGA